VISQEKHTIIKEAIKEVYKPLYEKLKPRGKEQIIIPHEFRTSRPLSSSLSEQEKEDMQLKNSFNLYRTYELIILLKEKGTLNKKLGQEEADKLYDDFIIWNDDKTAFQLNPNPFLRNVLLDIIAETEKNDQELKQFAITPAKIMKRTNFKREAIQSISPIALNKQLDGKNQNILKRKLTDKLTVREYILNNIEKYAKEPIDVFKFKHKIRNLGRTHAERHPERVLENEIKVIISRKDLTKDITEKEYSKLQTRSVDKVRRLLHELQNDEFLFLEIANGKLDVQLGKIYRLEKISLLPDGNEIYTLYINVNDQDFSHNNYVYLEDKDFEKDAEAELKFWKKVEGKLKIDDGRIKRIKNNKVLQAAHLKFQLFCRANFPPPINKTRILLDNFDKICGDIRAEVKKLVHDKRKPKLENKIVEIVRLKVLWIAKDCLKWLAGASLKAGNVNLVFKKQQKSKTEVPKLKIY
jgi:hypothetical protein